MNTLKTASLAFAAVLSLATISLAGPTTTTTTTTTRDSWSAFAKGNTELEVLAGAFWGVNTDGSPEKPHFGYALGSIGYSWMLNDPSGDGILRGNCEFLIRGFGAGIWEGPGSYLFGADLDLRFNF